MKRIACLIALLGSAILLSGCGGGSGSGAPAETGGKAVITIEWPTRDRLVPEAANSILIRIDEAGTEVDHQLAARPAAGGKTTVTFNSLPSGSFTAIATAFPNADGTGTALATASVPLTLTLNQTTRFTVTMASTINHLELTVPNPQILAATSEQLSVTAKNAAGAVVLTSADKLAWSSAQTTLATVDATGKVSGLLDGTATITVKDIESGKSVSTDIKVLLTIAAQPSTATLTLGQKQNFTVTIVGSANKAVDWSVQEGAAGGTITAAGVYTAPQTAGTFHVVAKSKADPSRTATATVTIQAGSATGTIQ